MNILLNKKYYTSPNPNLWHGRNTNLKNQYWYQTIKQQNLLDWNGKKVSDVALLGYACDEGVKRNMGRVGAKDAPNVVRERLAKLAIHHTKTVTDYGNIICDNGNLEECQASLSEAIKTLLQSKTFPIVIGGGHDIAYGHFNGIWDTVKDENLTIGIINFDAHFDLRPLETKANSGTPFYQILTEHEKKVKYCAIGIQKEANTKQLFEIAKQLNVETILNEDCHFGNFWSIKKTLNEFQKQVDYLYVTIDMDGFSSAYAPGVSAPSPLGFEPKFVMELLKFLFDSNKVISLDFAEFNPKYDVDNATANLVARLVDFVVGIMD